jgi:membrane dipeptidase
MGLSMQANRLTIELLYSQLAQSKGVSFMKRTLRAAMGMILVGVAGLAQSTSLEMGPVAISAGVRKLYQSAIVIDTHDDTPSRMLIEGVDISKRLPDGAVDIPRLKEGGVTGIFFSIWPDPAYAPHRAIRRSLEMIDAVRTLVDAHPDEVGLAVNASDVIRLKKEGKVAALMGLEGGHGIENSLAALRTFHRLGVRYMTLTHSNTNDWADSSTDTPRWHGLSDFGKQVVREMNRIGMMVDVSHVSDETFYAALLVSTKPVILSHSSCRALDNHPRNATDDMLRALAKNGGVIGINFYSEFVDQKFRDELVRRQKNLLGDMNRGVTKEEEDPDALVRKKWAEEQHYTDGIERPVFDTLIDQIDHAVKIAGIDHVGLGSDFDGAPSTPKGVDSVLDIIKIAQALRDKGYSDENIRKILGGNFLRVLREVTGE